MITEKNSTPKHIAIIMDGNGRWAEAKGLSRAEGHAQGVETLRQTLKLCKEFGIDYLTAYAFSTENWKRPKAEVDALMHLLIEYLKTEISKLKKEGIKLRVIGDTSLLPQEVQNAITFAINELDLTESKRVLTLALSYGSRDEIIRAVRKITAEVCSGNISIEAINETSFASFLDTSGLPDPDLLIRTAGELRLSNFLLWQLSYAELYATDIFWPDFSKKEFINALENFKNRTRKFGNISSKIN